MVFLKISSALFFYLTSTLLYLFQFLKRNADECFSAGSRYLLTLFGIKVCVHPAVEQHDKVLFVANHDSIMDAIILHAFLKKKTIIHGGISSIPLPFFKWQLQRNGYFILDQNARNGLAAIQYAIREIVDSGEFFLFPSGGVKIPIEQQCSKSVHAIAKRTGAMIVPIYFQYRADSSLLQEFKSDVSRFLYLFKKKEVEHVSVYFKTAINPTDYADADALVADLQSRFLRWRASHS